jgi:hypothetical protein
MTDGAAGKDLADTSETSAAGSGNRANPAVENPKVENPKVANGKVANGKVPRPR